jgi:serine/threonine-protein kinase
MSLASGTRLGPYEILSPLGSGGMGEVYRARDTKLNRDVALKILPDAFTGDPDRLARFTREAQTLAALNHPNIAHIHGFEDGGGVRALVMELVDGDDLAAQIARRRMPIDEVLPIARQIAVALAAAHDQGIIHRDLKPANVKVRPDGTVKVLDFGLAKALDPLASSPAAAALANSPTITTPAALTGAGVILGTAAYMSPEQARGKALDKRCDLWGFGAVLFEMLAGARAFRGEDVTDTIASVIAKEPDWDRLPADTPAAIRRLLRRCLAKDRSRRLSDAGDALLEIDEALIPSPAEASVAPRSAAARSARVWLVAGGLGIALGATIALLWRAPWQSAPPTQLQRLSADSGADGSLAISLGDSVSISPDGTVVAFVAQQGVAGRPQLYVRLLNQLRATALAGTEDASSPFFAPDGKWIGFFAGAKLKKIAVTGGAVVTVCDAENGRGGFWGDDGAIVFARLPPSLARDAGGLFSVSSAGGVARQITALADGDVTQRWPQVLPGGRAILSTGSRDAGDYSDAYLIVQTLPGGARKVVQPGSFHGRYLASGHLAYVHDQTLFAAPFDLERLELTGPPVPVIEDLRSNVSTGAAQFAASANGTFLYVAGRDGSGLGVPISWLDHDGKTTPLRITPANWFGICFSPDGQRLVLDVSSGRSGIGIYEIERDALTFLPNTGPTDRMPKWTPDGRRVTYASTRGDKSTFNLYWQPADGTGEPQRLTTSKNSQTPGSWHPGGKFLAFQELVGPADVDLMILPMEGDEKTGWKPGKPSVFLSTRFTETDPAFSPDGRWIAYVSDESGQRDVYVRPFQGSGKWRVSIDGGTFPTWSRAKPELFYGTDDGRIMVVSTSVDGESFHAGRPRLWSETRFGARASRMFDLHPDGERFAVAPAAQPQPAGKQDRLTFIFNFFDELRRVAPAAKR